MANTSNETKSNESQQIEGSNRYDGTLSTQSRELLEEIGNSLDMGYSVSGLINDYRGSVFEDCTILPGQEKPGQVSFPMGKAAVTRSITALYYGKLIERATESNLKREALPEETNRIIPALNELVTYRGGEVTVFQKAQHEVVDVEAEFNIANTFPKLEESLQALIPELKGNEPLLPESI